LRILREGKVDEIGGGLVQAMFVDVAQDTDDLCPIFAFVDRDAAAKGILVRPVALR